MHDILKHKVIFNFWHTILGMDKNDLAWHKSDIVEELNEFNNATGLFAKWSEVSDVVYTYTRARWTGHSEVLFPLSSTHFILGSFYMFPKYTLRWLFYVTAGKIAGSKNIIREVRNPHKISKLDQIADKNNLNKEEFRHVCQKLLKYWILLK